jgi:hypothetical protein
MSAHRPRALSNLAGDFRPFFPLHILASSTHCRLSRHARCPQRSEVVTMFLTVGPLLLTLGLAAGAVDTAVAGAVPGRLAQLSSMPIMLAEQAPAALQPPAFQARPKRPGALPILYGSLGALQALDVYSTRRALGAGAREANPLLAGAAQRSSAMLAVKAISTATSIYFTERAWKRNRKGAVVLMAVINGVTAAVVVRNLRQPR